MTGYQQTPVNILSTLPVLCTGCTKITLKAAQGTKKKDKRSTLNRNNSNGKTIATATESTSKKSKLNQEYVAAYN